MSQEDKFVDSSSFAPLGIIALESSKSIGKKVDDYIVTWRNARERRRNEGSSRTLRPASPPGGARSN